MIKKIIAAISKKYWDKKLGKMPAGEVRKLYYILKRDEAGELLTSEELEFVEYFVEKMKRI